MKCDELIAEKLSGESFGCEGGIYEVYEKSEVDAAIAELKDENRKLKRALWMARAKRAARQRKYRAEAKARKNLTVADGNLAA